MATATDVLRDEVRRRAQARLEDIRARRARYNTDLKAFAADCLTIRPKLGGDMLLRFNAVQDIVHGRLEAQRERTGRVRALILKARQPGVSTYIEARFYWRVSRKRGVRAFILTHHQEATDNIFEMAGRYHENNPHAPRTGASNAKELSFEDLDSGFAVGTAGAKGVGRGHTIQFFHGSEVAFWTNAQDHFSGALQAVPDAPDTEVILESTANGIGGLFYNMCQAAIRGTGEYELIFIPWFRHDEYRRPVPQGWRAPIALVEYGELHRLAPDQVYWATQKNADLAASDGKPAHEICWRFRQEYPATADEAFRAAREGAFIRGEDVLRARNFRAADQRHAATVLGCDFACGGEGEGGDANVFIDRQARRAGRQVYDRFNEHDTVSVANRLARTIDRIRPKMCFLDTGGGGAQVYDILKSRGYRNVLTLINFGGATHDPRRYANKRAEMWGDLRDWLMDPGGAQIPDEDVLDGDLTAPGAKEDLNQRTQLEKKADIRKRLGFSPDAGDALALTFAEPVRAEEGDDEDFETSEQGRSPIGGY